MDGSTLSRWLSSSIHVLSKISEVDILPLSSTESFVLTMYFIKTLAKVVIPAKRASHCIGSPRQLLYDRKYSFIQRRTSEEVINQVLNIWDQWYGKQLYTKSHAKHTKSLLHTVDNLLVSMLKRFYKEPHENKFYQFFLVEVDGEWHQRLDVIMS